MMFTRKPLRMLVAATALAGATLGGCRRSPDPQEYGEIITEVPERLNKPVQLPQLEQPTEESDEPTK